MLANEVPTTDQLLLAMLKGGVDKRTRDVIGTSIARSLRGSLPQLKLTTPLADRDAQIVAALRASGFASMDPIFSPLALDGILNYLENTPMIFYQVSPDEPGAIRCSFADRPQGFRFGRWEPEDLAACPGFMAAAHDPRLLSIAETYLEAPPTISIMVAWWSFPAHQPAVGMQLYHHDRDDFSTLKLFVYLTEVGTGDGPHQFIEETHTIDALNRFVGKRKWTMEQYQKFLQWMEVHRKSDADVNALFPPENIRTITGSRGSTFLEDTRGLHRGIPPETGTRLVFEICYTHLPKFNMTYNPIPRAKHLPSDDRIKRATRLYYR